MNSKLIIFIFFLFIVSFCDATETSNIYANSNLSAQSNIIRNVQMQITLIEHNEKKNLEKFKDYEGLFLSIGKENSAENLAWKGIVKAIQSKIARDNIGKLKALSLANKAKRYLELAIDKKWGVSNGEALNALAILYYKIPSWPIGFGSDKKARKYFGYALKCNPENPDVLWRQAEFFIAKNEHEKAIGNLKKASLLLKKRGRIEDKFKKNEVDILILQLSTIP